MLPKNEYSEIESRYYLNPQVGLDESNKFIENLRSTQQQNTAQIAKDTTALGTDVSSNLGGLGGGTDYWTARLSTPQTTSAVADLRATAQATALNQALENEQAIWKKRYQDAYRAYQKSAYDASKTSQTTTDQTTTKGGVDENDTSVDSTFNYDSSVAGVEGYYTVIGPDGRAHLVDMATGEEIVITPEANTSGSGSGGQGWSGGGSGGGGGGGR